jgi:murein DD-endopeptidase MepM/ murein hydrolase activator NlpD
LLSAQGSLLGARHSKQHDLAATQAAVHAWQQEANSLSAASAQIQAQIAAAQAKAAQAKAASPPPPAEGGSTSPPSPPSSQGLIWPVSGPLTSPFGMRWGSLHPGIDIGVGYGTPIHAAAAGTVLVASYNGGYGNLVVLDHGSSIATAYAHQSSIAVTVGQTVSQGEVIGYVGSTGFSTGPHLHFEVRVNGTPVDPLGYL